MKTGLMIALLVISILLTIIVMMQEGKEGGLTSSLTGGSDTYWSKNKGKSKEATLRKITVVLGVLYMGIALLISSKFI